MGLFEQEMIVCKVQINLVFSTGCLVVTLIESVGKLCDTNIGSVEEQGVLVSNLLWIWSSFETETMFLDSSGFSEKTLSEYQNKLFSCKSFSLFSPNDLSQEKIMNGIAPSYGKVTLLTNLINQERW